MDFLHIKGLGLKKREKWGHLGFGLIAGYHLTISPSVQNKTEKKLRKATQVSFYFFQLWWKPQIRTYESVKVVVIFVRHSKTWL